MGVQKMEDSIKAPNIFPLRVWKVVKIFLGIKTLKEDRPITSTILHVLTFSSALALFLTNLIYSGYNILTVNARNDILDGIVSIMVMSFCCFLGVYSQNLGYRLFTHPKIMQMMDQPVKWKRKAFIGLSFLLLLCYMSILNITTLNYTYSMHNLTRVNVSDDDDPIVDSVFNGPTVNPCQVVNLHLEICQVYWLSQLVFSFFFILWNILVATALLVTTRKVKFDIWTFNLMLQEEVYCIKENLRKSFNDGQWLACQDYLWLEEGESFALQELQIKNSVSPPNLIENLIDVEGKGNKNNTSLKEQYWELSVASRLISLAFQKWMGSIVAMVSTWSAIRCAFWFSNAPTWYGIFMFLLPLLIIPVLSSA